MGVMLVTSQTRGFIDAHRHENVRDLALKAKREDGLDLPFALDQIAGWQTARTKLPQWAASDGIIYPPHLSMEQCSSQFTAQYKARVARRIVDAYLASAASVATDAEVAATSANPATIAATDSTAATTASVESSAYDMPASSDDGTTLVDLTGGFGVDFSYLARGFDQATYVERQPHLCAIAEHNLHALDLTHTTVVNADAETWLADGGTATMIFVDPARRDDHGGRTVAIADCTPDVLALADRLFAAAPLVMVKLSPMLDWRKTVADFGGAVGEVHIVSTGNECKELLLVLDRRRTAGATAGATAGLPTGGSAAGATDVAAGVAVGPPADGSAAGAAVGSMTAVAGEDLPVRVVCVNDDDELAYDYDPSSPSVDRMVGTMAAGLLADGWYDLADADADADATDAAVDSDDAAGDVRDAESGARYLYEPNTSIMKAGCFALIEERYPMRQVGPNSHLFVSERRVDGFPGRAFAVEAVGGLGKKEVKSLLAGATKANVAVRNFPMSVAQLRKKLRLGDGGDIYLFATTFAGSRRVLIRTRRLLATRSDG